MVSFIRQRHSIPRPLPGFLLGAPLQPTLFPSLPCSGLSPCTLAPPLPTTLVTLTGETRWKNVKIHFKSKFGARSDG